MIEAERPAMLAVRGGQDEVLDQGGFGHASVVRHVHRSRRNTRRGGFTLIELMVALAIVTLLGTIVIGGFRQNEAKTAYVRFVDDLHGALITARHLAIDDQTRVRVRIAAAGVQVQRLNPATDIWTFVRLAERDGGRGTGPQSTGDAACVLAVHGGIPTPSRRREQEVSTSCLAGAAILTFEPDGRFSADVEGPENAGVAIWVGDRRIADVIRISMIQLFPGGHSRVFHDVGGVS